MSWVVDTCMVIDVLDDDPEFGLASASLLDSCAPDGLVLCPVSYIELGPAFLGDVARQDEFLRQTGISVRSEWIGTDTLAAWKAWHRHIDRKRRGGTARRPVADVMIGAFACRHQGLLTRNVADFTALFPSLTLRNS